MRIDILSVVPDLLTSPFSHSILKRAIDNGIGQIHIHNPRDFSSDNHKKVDDYMYGGGAGLVMTCQPIADCIESLKSERRDDEIIYMTPDGERLSQKIVNNYSTKKNIMILCGHYKGIDQRIRDIYITHEISIGDYVLSGGELGAAVLTDAILRIIPGAINNEESALTDSFQDDLLAPPVYTRPANFRGHKVPSVLMSGDFPKIEKWREEQSIKRTQDRRPDLLTDSNN
jgi:tRNA (guanine37-N1)-methyltransferase